MKTVLITGGAGFIGSHVARVFLEAGYEVAILDSFQRYFYPVQPWFFENTEYRRDRLLWGVNLIIERGSTEDRSDLRRIITSRTPDVIVHLAALPISNLAGRKSEEAFRAILGGTHNLLEVLRDYPCKLVYISSSMIYGDFEQVPVLESSRKRPKTIYGAMKLAGEQLVEAYADTYAFNYSIVRPSAVYGPSDCNQRVVQKFLQEAIKGLPIVVIQGNDTVMDFTYVEDVAKGIYLVAVSPGGGVYNVTKGEGRSLNELVTIIKKLIPEVKVGYIPDRARRPRRGALDISKARAELKYDPKWSLEEGVAMYLSYILHHNPSLLEEFTA